MTFKNRVSAMLCVLAVLAIVVQPCFAVVKPLGKITVVTAGTRVQVYSSTGTQANRVTTIIIQYPANTASGGNNTGKLYVGNATVVGSTLTGVIAALDPGGSITIPSGGANLDASTIYLDSDNNGAYALVSVVY